MSASGDGSGYSDESIPRRSGGGGAAIGGLAAALVVGLIGLKIAIKTNRLTGWLDADDPEVAAAPAAPAPAPAEPIDWVPAPILDFPASPDGAGSTEGVPDEAAPGRPAEPPPPTEEEVLGRIRATGGDERLAALQTWREHALDAAPGARLRALEALGGRVDGAAATLLADSIREQPPGLDESLECLKSPVVGPGLRRVLLDHLARGFPLEPDRVAAGLQALPETPDLQLEESLALLGRARTGAVARLLQSRGPEWALAARGREVLGASLRQEPGEAAALLEAADPALRQLACELLGQAAGESAVRLVVPLLRDEAAVVREAAAACLQTQGDPRSSWPLARALEREQDGAVRGRLEGALLALPRQRTVEHLEALARRPAREDRLAAIRAARTLGRIEALRLVGSLLRDPDREVRAAALAAIDALSRDRTLQASLTALAERDLRPAATADADPQLRRVARDLYFAITGRLPR